jgi:hypothetical protein
MTRRGAIQTAELSDRTEYLVTRLQGPALEQFLSQRGRDIPVVRACDGWRPNPATLIAMGPFAPGFDHERGQNLLARGLEELVRGLP